MQIIQVTQENLDREHICCAITEKKGESCVAAKKAWLKERLAEGLTFRKLDVRGKVFIETIPAESAWYPIDAPGYLHIDCFWVSGQYKGRGYGKQLLGAAIEDARGQGKHGLTVVSADKKRPFLSDPKFLAHHGFREADAAKPFFRLLYLPFEEGAPVPHFRPSAKEGTSPDEGMAIYYTDQCPFAGLYAQRIQEIAVNSGHQLTLVKLSSAQQAQDAPSPFATYSFFDGGQFITNEILSPTKFTEYLKRRG